MIRRTSDVGRRTYWAPLFRHPILRLPTIICVLALLLLLLAGCRAGPQPQVYQMAMESDFRTLDPLRLNTGIEPPSNIYNALVAYPPQGTVPLERLTDIVPDLAERWEISRDGRTYTFHLRRGVRFHNGRPLEASDIRFSFERLLDPRNASTGLWTGQALTLRGLEAFQQGRKAGRPVHLAGVQVLDRSTVRILLDKPVPFALHLLAMPYYYIVPREETERWGADYARHPVGTGPFSFVEWRQGQYLRLERNPHYFEPGKPYLDGILYRIIPGEQQRFLSFLNGELEDTAIPVAEFDKVLRDPQWNAVGPQALLDAPYFLDLSRSRILKAPSFTTFYLGMNNRQPPFDDRRVRQAFNYAIDKERLAGQILGGRAIVARGVLPPAFPGFDPARPLRYLYDPQRARAMLEAAGWRDSPGGSRRRGDRSLQVTLWYPLVDELSTKVVAAVQADLKAVGAEVEVRALNYASFMDKVDRREAVFFRISWQADYPDPDNFLWTLFDSGNIGQSNRAQFSDPEVDRLLRLARSIRDWPLREKLYRQAETRIVELAPWVFLYHPVNYRIVQPAVSRQGLHPLPVSYFKEVRINRNQ